MKHGYRMAVTISVLLIVLIGAYVYMSYMYSDPRHAISVILRGNEDGEWDTARMGMEQAAREEDVTLNFITLVSEGSTSDHIDAIRREIAQDVSAIIAIPCGEEIELDSGMRSIVLVQIDGCITGNAPSIRPDNDAIGRGLARIAHEEEALGAGETYIALPSLRTAATEARAKALREELEALGIVYTEIQLSTESGDDGRGLAELVVTSPGDCLFALDPSTLLRAGKSNALDGRNLAVYGVGMTASLCTLMDAGHIRALIATDQYGEGYLAVKAAVEILEGKRARKGGGELVAHEVITAETLFDEANLRFLFPYVK